MTKDLKKLPNSLKSILDHFIAEKGYPIRVNKKQAKDIQKAFPFLKQTELHPKENYMDDSEKNSRNFKIEVVKIPDSVKAEYWKLRFEEMQDEYENLYQQIKKIANTY